jgi:hypothetical protein
MKNIKSLFVASLLSISGFVSAQCTIDPSNTEFLAPQPQDLPCIERSVSYNQTIQIAVPTSIDLSTIAPGIPFPITLTVDSVNITSIDGFPTGIIYTLNPATGVFYGGTNGCAQLSGTTTDPAGNYPLSFNGTITLSGLPSIPGFSLPPDTTVDLAVLQAQPQNPFSFFVDVIEQGAACRPNTSINKFNTELNSAIRITPNPNNGTFEFTLNAGRNVNGQIKIVDITGREVYTENLDVTGFYNTRIDLRQFAKGLYTLQLRTAEGFASKSIVVE